MHDAGIGRQVHDLATDPFVAEPPSLARCGASWKRHQTIVIYLFEDNALEALSPSMKLRRLLGMMVRAIIPVALLGAGIYAFLGLSIPVEKEMKPEEEEKLIRTAVDELKVSDYQVVIKTQGIIQTHNEVTLSAEVSGQVRNVSDRFEAGAYFQKGDVLVELDDRDYVTAIEIAEAQLASSQAALELANQNYTRLSKLLRSNNVAEAEVKEAEATRRQAVATVETNKAGVEQAQRDLQRTRIKAPFNGRVLAKNIGLGQTVSPGTPLGIAFAVDYAEVRLPLASRELPYLNLPERETDPPLEVVLRSTIGRHNNTQWNARIVRTEGTLDADSLELFAIARIDDPFGLESNQPPLRIGQPVTAEIPGEKLENVIALPRAAVRQLNQVFFVDRTDLTLSSKTIEPVWSEEDWIIVRDRSIQDGDWLATTNLVYAPDGAKVDIIPEIELVANSDDSSVSASRTN